ncbi:MAG: HAD family phosphatase [archaeon]
MMKAAIFDMDGVLVDNLGYNTIAFNELLSKYGIHLDAAYRKKTRGRSLRDQIQMWKEDFGIMEEIDPLDFSKRAFAIQLRLAKENIKPDEDLQRLIGELKENKIKLAVATSSTTDRAKTLLDLVEVRDKLDVLVTSEDVEKHKPNPDIFLKAAEELGVDPVDCIVFEDALNGIQAANAAGMKSIALLTEHTTKEDFEGLVDLVIRSFSEINVSKLKSLFGD